jgi:hypothetical protein
VRTKDSCWSVGTIYDPRELPGVRTAGPGIGRGVTPAYSSSIHCPIQMWNGTVINLWYIHSPFAYLDWGAPPFYTF